MTILIAYDGSTNADSAIAKAATLIAPKEASAVVLTIWEPLVLQAIRAERFGSMFLAVPSDVVGEDKHTAEVARQLAEHGARLAGEAGFDAPRALWIADNRNIANAIVESADELDVDLIVMGARGLAGISAFVGSVSNHVLQHTHRPVLIVPAGSSSGPAEAATEATAAPADV